ncbi:MAG: TetR/AcrR family transcriptional regulator [Spirochaetes bacterium]|nr:TetR/AcrR family transcriptional regulator [Spirochaetota bacterium]
MKKGEKTRDRLLKCAEKAFSKKGYYETQVSDIVKLAHVAKGTIYQYFKNKEEIFSTLLETYIHA